MKRNTRRQRNSKKIQKGATVRNRGAQKSTRSTDRRDLLTQARNWGVVGVLFAGVGWYMIDEVTAMFAEHDLSRIGNGTPAVVQIHDPQCPRCRDLQRETRRALRTLDDGALQYLIANIRTDTGRNFASKHGVGHVTLLLFDAKGKRRSILRGNRNSGMLSSIFRSHLQFSGEK